MNKHEAVICATCGTRGKWSDELGDYTCQYCPPPGIIGTDFYIDKGLFWPFPLKNLQTMRRDKLQLTYLIEEEE